MSFSVTTTQLLKYNLPEVLQLFNFFFPFFQPKSLKHVEVFFRIVFFFLLCWAILTSSWSENQRINEVERNASRKCNVVYDMTATTSTFHKFSSFPILKSEQKIIFFFQKGDGVGWLWKCWLFSSERVLSLTKLFTQFYLSFSIASIFPTGIKSDQMYLRKKTNS